MKSNTKAYLALGVMFLTGATAGAAVSYTLLKVKFEKDLKEELDSVIEEFKKSPRVIFKDKGHEDRVKEEQELRESIKKNIPKDYYYSENGAPEDLDVRDTGEEYDPDEDDFVPLTDEEAFETEEGYVGKVNMHTALEPFTITRDECDEFLEEDYATCFWTIYETEDGGHIITNDLDEIVKSDELMRTVGLDIAGKIGEYEPEIAIVCNNRLRCIFEITEDVRNYADVVKAMPFINS